MEELITGIKRGDYARVVVEGKVTGLGGDWIELDGNYIDTDEDWVKSVEKIEAPVTVFTTGDRVKELDDWSETHYLIINDGYVNLSKQIFYPHDNEWLASEFTSKRYKKVY